MRNLTLEGKILIVKTFGLSQLIYALQSTTINESDLIRIENIIFRFIWSIKKTCKINSGKICRDVLKSSKDKGGLRAPSISTINNCLKYKNLIRYISNSNNSHPINALYQNKLNSLGFDWPSFASTSVDKSYLGCAIKVHLTVGKNLRNDLKTLANQSEGIHKNYYAFMQNTPIAKNEFININQQFMIARLKAYNINTIP